MRKIVLAITAALAVALAAAHPPRAAVRDADPVVPLRAFGAAGGGGDDTAVIQAGINRTAERHQTLEIPPARAGRYHVRPLAIPSDASILLDAGTTVEAVPGYTANQRMLNVVNVRHVSLVGTPGRSVFQMRGPEYTSGEYRHCLNIEGATDVRVAGIQCNGSGGDGLYISGGRQGYSADIAVTDCGFDGNRRQGASIISVRGLTINRCTFTNAHGTDPDDGIDIEPNQAGDHLQDILIQNCRITGNAGTAISFAVGGLSPVSAPVSITAVRITSVGNGLGGFLAANGHDNGRGGPPGKITLRDSSSTGDGTYGVWAHFFDVPGPQFTVTNVTVTDANRLGTTDDGAAVAVERGGGDASVEGNVSMQRLTIDDPQGRLKTYCAVEDYSHVGLQNIHIGNFGALHGLPPTSPRCVVNGVGQDSVNISRMELAKHQSTPNNSP